jgi:hypothetical protein
VQPLRQGISLEPDGGNGALLFPGPTQQFFRFTAVSASFSILPCSLITQIAVFAGDTSNPTNSLIPQFFFWIRYGKVDNLPLTLQAVTGRARRRPRSSISLIVKA